MTPRGSVRSAKLEDAVFIAPRLRPADRNEVLAASGMEPSVILPKAFTPGADNYCIVSAQGTPMALFGTHPFLQPGVGIVWMVATEELLLYSRQVLRQGGEWVDRLHRKYDTLVNCVDARNTVHIKWLKRSGFILLARRERYGAAQLPFIEFAKVK